MLTASHTVIVSRYDLALSENGKVYLERDRVAAVSSQTECELTFSSAMMASLRLMLAVNDPRRDLALMMKRWHSEENPDLVPT
jgi:hypothetical protein